MNATIKLENAKHFPVLLEEISSIISPLYGGTFIDCTFGEGGYSKKILENKSNKILAIDRDKSNFKIINQFKKKYQGRFDFENKKFSEILNTEKKINNLKGIIFDLGYSTTQIKDPKKGLSFNSKGKLNMRMGFNSISASDVINKLEQKELSRIFKIFGEERQSNIISKKIKIDLRKTHTVGSAVIDLNKMLIKLNNNQRKINVTEKKILMEMLSNPGKTYSRLQIGELSGILQERSIDVMITRLRQKIEIDPKNPKYLQTIRGSGYVLWIE